LWQAAARVDGAEAARCGTGIGRGSGANCAKAGDKNANAASAAIAIGGEQKRGIMLPARMQVHLARNYPNRRKKEMFLRRARCGSESVRGHGHPTAMMRVHFSIINHGTMSRRPFTVSPSRASSVLIESAAKLRFLF
jgi:hypothetical protein